MKAFTLKSTSESAPTSKPKGVVVYAGSVPPRFLQTASVQEAPIQRKADCACGGGCPRCAGESHHPGIQTKLAVSTPGDPYEQEADRVAAQVMNTHVPGQHPEVGFIKSPGAAVQRKCAECEDNEEVIQKKDRAGQPDDTHQGQDVSPLVHEVLGSSGQPLDTETRAFMEPRFGFDFGNVKIHNDSSAHRSSEDIHALAYTHGDHIVFGEGQYRPRTSAGRELIAHELAHVAQQKSSGNAGKLFRRIDYAREPRFSPPTNAIEKFLAGSNLALTTPTVNGTPLPDVLNDAGTIIFEAFRLHVTCTSIKQVDGKNVCSYDEPVITISANISMVAAPSREKWEGQTRGSNYASRNSNCRGKGNIPVVATGDPRATTIHDNMRSNEMEHFNDLKALGTRHLGGLLTLMRSFRDTTATSAEDCQQKFSTFINPRDAQAIKAFLEAVSAKVVQRDVRPGPHLFIPQVTIAEDCSRITIVVKRSR